MRNYQDINKFIENELQHIIATLDDDTLFERIKAEELSINKTIDQYRQHGELEFKQEQNRIMQVFAAKTTKVKALIEAFGNEKNFSMNREFSDQLEEALQELVSKIEYERENEIRILQERLNKKVVGIIEEYKEKIKDIPGKRIDEISKIIGEKSNQLKVLDDHYETASFNADIWKGTAKVLESIIEEERKENEVKETYRHQRKEITESINFFPKVNYLRFDESFKEVDIFGKSIGVKIPRIESFFAKNSISIIYKATQRNTLKNRIDQCVLRCLMAAESGNILFYFIDSYGNGSIFLDLLNLPKEIYNDKIYTQTYEIDKVIAELQKIEIEIMQTQLKSYNIVDYNLEFPKSCIPYRVIIFDNFPKGYSSNALPAIEKLLRTGSNAGIHFLFIIDDANIEDQIVQKILNQTVHIHISDPMSSQVVKSMDEIKKNVLEISNKKFNKVRTLYFEDFFHDDFEYWTQKSAKQLSVPIGVKGKDDYYLTFKGENAHCVITGTTGSGKSCFIHSLITSACLNYSPNELRLFLIDLKSGVEFQNYAFEQLPHADFIALQSDPQYALHILSLFKNKIEERGVKFTEKGITAKNLNEFKEKFPDEIMPRYLIIIDEYENLFQNYEDRHRALGLINYVAKEGRSFGLNLVLASQNPALPLEVMANFGLKVLMKVLSNLPGSELLGANIDSSYKAKAELLKPGQAFIPEETVVSKIQSYFLVEDQHIKYLKSIKNKWDNFEGSKFEQNLIVFSREAPSFINRNKTIKALSGKQKTDLVFSPGEKVMVDGVDFICQLKREKNNNILFLGGESDVSLRAVHGTILSLLPQLSKKNAQIEIFNFVLKREKQFYEKIKNSAVIIKSYFRNANYFEDGMDINQKLKEYKNDLEDRMQNKVKESDFPLRILVFYNIENNIEFQQILKRPETSLELEPFPSENTEILIEIMRQGPQVGMHCLIHAADPENYYKVFDHENNDHTLFNYRIFGQISPDDSKDLIHDRCTEAAFIVEDALGEKGKNRILCFDASKHVFQSLPVLKPYEFIEENELNDLLSVINI